MILGTASDGEHRPASDRLHPFHPFCCQCGGARTHADVERHVPELYDCVSNKDEAAPVMWCAILDVVSWFPGVLQQLWMDVSVRCRHARTSQRKCVETRGGCSCWRSGESEVLRYGRAIVGLRGLWKTWRRRGQVAA